MNDFGEDDNTCTDNLERASNLLNDIIQVLLQITTCVSWLCAQS